MGGTGVDGVTVRRGERTVLRDVTLVADDGELLAVLGSSGSGKSTLLRTVAGLERPVAGRVLVRGRTVTTLPPGRRNLAMVFESGALMPFLDVAHNLGWGLRARHVPEGEVRERVSGRARQLRLGRLLSRKPGALSHGERGLVGVGRALVARPDAFLLDEPLGHLDVAERLRVRQQIVGVVRSVGVTMLYVTHDQAEALAIADRVAVLHDGQVRQVAPPRVLYERPADLVVAGSVGYPPIGLVSARLVAAGGLAGFAVGARTLPLWTPVPEPLRPYVDREVVLGLRAKHVDATGGAEPSAVTLDAIVTGVEFTGRQQVVTAAVGAPPVTAPGADTVAGASAGALLRSLSPPRSEVRRGDELRLAVDATRAAVFDAATGRAIWHGG